jgi:hypothetical protein
MQRPSQKCKTLRHICDTKAKSIHPLTTLFRGDAGHVFVKVLLSLGMVVKAEGCSPQAKFWLSSCEV